MPSPSKKIITIVKKKYRTFFEREIIKMPEKIAFTNTLKTLVAYTPPNLTRYIKGVAARGRPERTTNDGRGAKRAANISESKYAMETTEMKNSDFIEYRLSKMTKTINGKKKSNSKNKRSGSGMYEPTSSKNTVR